MEFGAVPHTRNAYQMQIIFRGSSDLAAQDCVKFTIESIAKIHDTVELYEVSQPWKDYTRLLEIWHEVDPEMVYP